MKILYPLFLPIAVSLTIPRGPTTLCDRLDSSWSLRMATSSSDLKTVKRKRKKGSIAARLSTAAKEAAEKNKVERIRLSKQSTEKIKHENEGDNLSSISKLSKSIDEELLRPSDGYRPIRETSSMRILLEHNDRLEASDVPKEALGCRHVAVVFSKPLWKDQITTEYASRLVSLARAMKDDDYKPTLICFCGSTETSKSNLVAETSAGVIFFRHLCATNEISLEDTDLCVVRQEKNDHTWSSSSLNSLVEEVIVRGRYLKKWLEKSDVYERPTDEYGLTRQKQRKNIHVHLTLISTDYHLCNLNDIHVRSPRQSPLKALEHELEHAAKIYKGIAKTTWSFRYSTYPYVYSKNEVAAFLGKCYLMAQELQPLLVNLRGVEDQVEFFQRDNYRALVGTRRSLVALMEEMNEAFSHNQLRKTATASVPPNLKAELQQIFVKGRSGQVSADVALEGAMLSIGRCVDLVRPAGTLSSQSVPRSDWTNAVKKLESFLEFMQISADPDRPLPAGDWGKLSLENVKTFSTSLGSSIFNEAK